MTLCACARRHSQSDEAASCSAAPAAPSALDAAAPPPGYVCGRCQAEGSHYRSDCPRAAPPLKRPSGFNIFVENLTESVNEIHRDVRSSLPSMDVGVDDDYDSSDGEAEVPILTPRGARIAAAARDGAA